MNNNYGVKISKPGVDVVNAGLKDLYFHSNNPLLKIYDIVSGSTSLTDGGAGFNVQVTQHSLGYEPKAELWAAYYDPFLNTEISEYELMPLTERSSGGVIGMFYTVSKDSSEIRFLGETYGGDSASHTINYYCVVYYDEDL